MQRRQEGREVGLIKDRYQFREETEIAGRGAHAHRILQEVVDLQSLSEAAVLQNQEVHQSPSEAQEGILLQTLPQNLPEAVLPLIRKPT